MARFACSALGIKSLAPPAASVAHLLEQEAEGGEPVLFIVSPGADPSPELAECAAQAVGRWADGRVAWLACLLAELCWCAPARWNW
jgi:hypothetical protein